jgi:hypothetical protein
MHLTPVKQVTVEPGCLLPENFTGNSSDHSELDLKDGRTFRDTFILNTSLLLQFFLLYTNHRRFIKINKTFAHAFSNAA